jgi:DNA polymerase-3 subunit epsilon
MSTNLDDVAVLDFETTGMSPGYDRPTEIALVIVRSGKIVDKFQSLMNPGRSIPWNVQALTGISNEMVASAPSVKSVMLEVSKFVGHRPLLAHNAAFDRRFWQAELEMLGRWNEHQFACTMLLARRVYPSASSHKLGSLSSMLSLPPSGRAHRAMADVLTTVHLFDKIQEDLKRSFGLKSVDHGLLQQIQSRSKHHVPSFLRQVATRQS